MSYSELMSEILRLDDWRWLHTYVSYIALTCPS